MPTPKRVAVACLLNGAAVFICKWARPTGTPPNWTLSSTDCSQFERLNDSFLDANTPAFAIIADEFVRQRN